MRESVCVHVCVGLSVSVAASVCLSVSHSAWQPWAPICSEAQMSLHLEESAIQSTAATRERKKVRRHKEK